MEEEKGREDGKTFHVICITFIMQDEVNYSAVSLRCYFGALRAYPCTVQIVAPFPIPLRQVE